MTETKGTYDDVVMREVLEWADDNVASCMGPKVFGKGGWCVNTSPIRSCQYQSQTLYQALHKAWKEEHERKN